MRNTCVILETAPWIHYLVMASQAFATPTELTVDAVGGERRETYPAIEPLTARQALAILHALATETLTQCSPFQVVTPATLAIAQAITQRLDVTPADLAFADRLMEHEAADHVAVDFHGYVARFVMQATYHRWEVRYEGLQLLLMCGDDYRIEQYEQDLPDGQLTLPLHGVTNYIHRECGGVWGWPIQAMLVEALKPLSQQWCFAEPTVAFDRHSPVFQKLQQAVAVFYRTLIAPRLQQQQSYEACVTENLTLVLNVTATPPMQAYIECELLKASIERGDYVSARDRQRLHDLERHYAH